MADTSICENMLIMTHVSHISTDKEGKKNLKYAICMPIDTNQHNPTKIIDGCQEKTAVAKNAAMQYG